MSSAEKLKNELRAVRLQSCALALLISVIFNGVLGAIPTATARRKGKIPKSIRAQAFELVDRTGGLCGEWRCTPDGGSSLTLYNRADGRGISLFATGNGATLIISNNDESRNWVMTSVDDSADLWVDGPAARHFWMRTSQDELFLRIWDVEDQLVLDVPKRGPKPAPARSLGIH